MDQIRVGTVRYLNTAPIVEGLDALETVELSPAAPSRIIDLLARGEIDVGLVSLIDAARAPVPVAMLPVGMIGCDGPTMTVRLFSRVPFDRVTRLHADAESHTSVVLARIVLDRRFGVRPELVDFDARERVAVDRPGAEGDGQWPETMLLIGDKVITEAPEPGSYPHELDLGEAWHELTGLPFVYAVWMCRADESETPSIRAASAALERQRRRNRERLDWIIARRAPEHRWPIDTATRYLRELLRYEVGPREREAVDRFMDEAARLGVVERVSPPWAGAPAPA